MRGSPHCQSTLTRIAVRCTCSTRLSNSKRESFIEAWSQLFRDLKAQELSLKSILGIDTAAES